MDKTKRLWNMLAAVAIIALPLALLACSGSDDDDTPRGPQSYMYSWALVDGIDLNRQTIENQEKIIEARKMVNGRVVHTYDSIGFLVDSQKQQFTITLQPTSSITRYDELVEEAFLTMKRTDTLFQKAAAMLPASASLNIRRGEDIIVNRTLRMQE